MVAGDALLVVRASDGRSRPCVVGRCKVCSRPDGLLSAARLPLLVRAVTTLIALIALIALIW